MNKLITLGAVAFLALNTTAIAKPKVFTVSFDGTCDTMTLTYNRDLVLYAVLHQTDCAGAKLHVPSSNPIPGVGIIVKRNPCGGCSNAKDLAVTDTVPDDLGAPVAYIYKLEYPLVTGGTWTAYATSDGHVVGQAATGTYTSR
jgi:hypothetical protein